MRGIYACTALPVAPNQRRRVYARVALAGVVYVALLGASHVVEGSRAREPATAPASPAGSLRSGPIGSHENGSSVAGTAHAGVASEGAVASRAERDEPVLSSITLPHFNERGAVPDTTGQVVYARWDPPTPSPLGVGSPRAGVVLLHGSPGSWRDFRALAPLVARAGYTVIAPDLPGFGASSPDPASYSTLAHARAVLALMQSLGVSRAHVVGFSMGGGVALHLADLASPSAPASSDVSRPLHDPHAPDPAPASVASITLLSSVSTQETEGSGAYVFEHFKYALGRAGLVWLPRAVPHFGLLGPERFRRAVVRNFADTDQRLLAPIMASLRVPTLILHGRDDFLVPDFGAARAHELIGPSRLVVLDASHFIPFLQADLAAAHLLPFLDRHDDPGAPALRFTADFAPPGPPLMGALGEALTPVWRGVAWWARLALLALCARVRPRLTIAAAALLVAGVELDPVLAGVGIYLGRSAALAGSLARRASARHARDWARRIESGSLLRTLAHAVFVPGRAREAAAAASSSGSALRPLAIAILGAWVLVVPVLLAVFFLVVTALIAGPVLAAAAGLGTGVLPALVALLVTALGVHVLRSLPSRTGRLLLAADVARARHHEFWPGVLFYAPMGVYLPLLALRYRSTLAFTCCNPGIAAGGGTIGENKSDIYARFFAAASGPPDRAPSAARADASDDDGASVRGRAVDAFVESRLLPLVRVPVLARDVPGAARLALGLPDAGRADRLSPEDRARLCLFITRNDPRLALPLILKPDSAQRGFALRLARTPDDVLAFFRSFTRDAVAQAYHPGPVEIGVLWVRHPGPLGAGETRHGSGPAGFVFAVTEKVFPRLTPDGRRTLEELILTHPRFRLQAAVFLERFAGSLRDVPAPPRRPRPGDPHGGGGGHGAEGPDAATICLGLAGNHCQGTLFRDGAHLLTPELESAVDRVARSFTKPDASPGGLDFGRFDLRAVSLEALRRGEFAVVELNGAASEATNIYDPDRSLLWAYSVVFRQWALLYRLGSIRRAQGKARGDAGARPLGNLELVVRLRRYYRNRPGSAVSD